MNNKPDFEGFSKAAMQTLFDEGGLDPFDLQDMGLEYKLLKEVQVTEPCGEYCNCSENDNIPGLCYQPTYKD